MGTIANGKYLLFDLKFMALPKGIGCKAFAFDRSRLKVIGGMLLLANLTIGEN
jgi:hypothetical protein